MVENAPTFLTLFYNNNIWTNIMITLTDLKLDGQVVLGKANNSYSSADMPSEVA
jgi:hypothetical protein